MGFAHFEGMAGPSLKGKLTVEGGRLSETYKITGRVEKFVTSKTFFVDIRGGTSRLSLGDERKQLVEGCLVKGPLMRRRSRFGWGGQRSTGVFNKQGRGKKGEKNRLLDSILKEISAGLGCGGSKPDLPRKSRKETARNTERTKNTINRKRKFEKTPVYL